MIVDIQSHLAMSRTVLLHQLLQIQSLIKVLRSDENYWEIDPVIFDESLPGYSLEAMMNGDIQQGGLLRRYCVAIAVFLEIMLKML